MNNGVQKKELSDAMRGAVERSMMLMLVSAYQVSSWRWQDKNPGKEYDLQNPYLDNRVADYGEAFGMVRALTVMGYGYLGAVNVEDGRNLRPWFEQCVDAAAEEVTTCGGVDEAMRKWNEIVNTRGDYWETSRGRRPSS